jgi:hypothetical protein
MSRDVYTIFQHGGDGSGIDACGVDACAINFGFAASKVTEITFSHLAAATVGGAEDQYFFHRFRV